MNSRRARSSFSSRSAHALERGGQLAQLVVAAVHDRLVEAAARDPVGRALEPADPARVHRRARHSRAGARRGARSGRPRAGAASRTATLESGSASESLSSTTDAARADGSATSANAPPVALTVPRCERAGARPRAARSRSRSTSRDEVGVRVGRRLKQRGSARALVDDDPRAGRRAASRRTPARVARRRRSRPSATVAASCSSWSSFASTSRLSSVGTTIGYATASAPATTSEQREREPEPDAPDHGAHISARGSGSRRRARSGSAPARAGRSSIFSRRCRTWTSIVRGSR